MLRSSPRNSYRNRLASGPVILMLVALLFETAPTSAPPSDSRTLSFYHTHTAERLTVTYYRDPSYDRDALARLNHFLRDFRTDEWIEMDPAVFDILYEIQRATGSRGTFEVISAYRSPRTNEMLRRNSSGVAEHSQHLKGTAIDIRLTDLDTAVLRDVAIELQRGGVGYYARSDFVHVDTGRVRRW